MTRCSHELKVPSEDCTLSLEYFRKKIISSKKLDQNFKNAKSSVSTKRRLNDMECHWEESNQIMTERKTRQITTATDLRNIKTCIP